jgi:hypothetical protein
MRLAPRENHTIKCSLKLLHDQPGLPEKQRLQLVANQVEVVIYCDVHAGEYGLCPSGNIFQQMIMGIVLMDMRRDGRMCVLSPFSALLSVPAANPLVFAP